MSYYTGPITDHFNGKQFYHAGLPATDKSLFDLLRWQIFGKRAKWPHSVPARAGLEADPAVNDLRITCIGHASLLIQTAGINILIDPVWSDRVSPLHVFSVRRRHNPPAVFARRSPSHPRRPRHPQSIRPHGYGNHLAAIYARHKLLILSPLGNDTVIHKDAPEIPVQTGDWWQTFPLSPYIRVTIVPAYHWSARKLGDRRQALWCGFVLDTPSGRIYCAGDTGYQDGKIFTEIRRRCGVPLVAALPIGAYEPRWFMSTQHADPAEAVKIAIDVGAQHLLGIHWGTFQLTDEPWDEPPALLESTLRQRTLPGLQAQALRPGDTWSPN